MYAKYYKQGSQNMAFSTDHSVAAFNLNMFTVSIVYLNLCYFVCIRHRFVLT